MIEADLNDIFAKYQALVAQVDAVFAKVRDLYPQEICCARECADCCHATFDITLVEAMYLNQRFTELYPKGDERHRLTVAANEADREHYRLKHKAWKAHKAGVEDESIVLDMAKERVRCPLLTGDNVCQMYETRPLTCRLYGAPQDIGGALRACPKTGFAPGGKYQAVRIDKIQERLHGLSREIVERVGGKYEYLSEMLVPLSMAILTDYDDKFFGLGEDQEE